MINDFPTNALTVLMEHGDFVLEHCFMRGAPCFTVDDCAGSASPDKPYEGVIMRWRGDPTVCAYATVYRDLPEWYSMLGTNLSAISNVPYAHALIIEAVRRLRGLPPRHIKPQSPDLPNELNYPSDLEDDYVKRWGSDE